jgi:hypothetical protein
MNEPNVPRPKLSALPGLAAIGLMGTGVASLIHAFLSGSPLGLFAAAISFGVVFVMAFI